MDKIWISAGAPTASLQRSARPAAGFWGGKRKNGKGWRDENGKGSGEEQRGR